MERITLREAIPAISCGSSIVILYFIRRIKDPIVRKWVSSAHGLAVFITVCGWGFLHLLINYLGCSLIILYGNKRYCHVACFLFAYTHLAIYHLEDYLGLPLAPVYTYNAVNTVMFKMVNLAMEVQDIYCDSKKKDLSSESVIQNNGNDNYSDDKKEKEAIKKRNQVYKNLTLLEILHYNMNGCSVFTFLTYRTYYDWVHQPSKFATSNKEIIREIKYCIIMGLVCLPVSLLFPAEYIKTNEFYKQSMSYRVVYCIFVGFGCRLAMFMLFTWITALAMVTGMGAYPSSTKPRPGKGPTTGFTLLQEIAENPEKGKKEEYNFETVRNCDFLKAEFSPILRDFWRYYNCAGTYFLTANVYKRFPVVQLKMFAVFFLSAWWHGFHAGFYLALCYTAFYIPTEDLWHKLFRKDATGITRVIWDVIFFAGRLLAMTYISTTTYLQWYDEAIRFTASLYFLPYIVPIVLFGVGKCIEKSS